MENPQDIYQVAPKNLVRLEVLIHQAQKKELEEVAKRAGRSMADLVREGIAIILTGYGGLK
jgi:predicted transcriptional regulator